MNDVVSPDVRSRMMSGIGRKDTKPELALRRELHRRGFRFRLHERRLPGRPDIVLPRWQAVIFVHGCFWHRHEGCTLTATPRTRREFWQNKFAENVARDRRNADQLAQLGWRVHTVWECEIRRDVDKAARDVEAWLTSDFPVVISAC